MSLQVWLPLNGSLENQGLSNVTATNHGATVNNNGKIGKCYQNIASNYITIPVTINVKQPFSLCYWYRIDTWKNWGTTITLNTANEDYIGMCPSSNGTSIGTNWYELRNGTSTKIFDGYHSNIITVGQWNHIAIIFDGVNNIKTYINGILVSNGTVATSPLANFTELTLFRRGRNATYGYSSLNDVRVYDHALSPKEVQELAKGLVLHYRLAGPGQENIIKASGPKEDGWGINQSGGTFTKTITEEGTSFEVTTQATSWFLYYHKFTNLSTAGLKPNTEYTYSFECKSNQSFNLDIKILKGNGTIPLTNNKAIRIEGDNEWHRYKVTLTTNSTLDISDQYFYMNGGNVIAKTQFRYAKLEEGTIATPWTPHPSDALWTAMGYSNNIEYDCSGFGYNSTIKYPPVWDVNSPRYTTSYKFDGTAYLIVPNPFPVGAVVKEFTHTAWIKWDSACNTNSGIHSIAFGNEFFRFALGKGSQIWTYGIRCEADGPGTSQTAILTHGALGNLVHNKWYFIAIAFKDGACKAYIDGELVASNTSAKVGLKSNTTEGAIGAYTSGGNERAIGNISDSRFYATELSAADIQELYHSAVIIDNTGKTYAYEYFE